MRFLFQFFFVLVFLGSKIPAFSQSCEFCAVSDKVSFETASSLISISTSLGNTWQIGSPIKSIFNSGYNSPNAIVTSLASAPGVTISEFTYWIDTLGSSSTIYFDQRLDLDPLTDTARIYAKFIRSDSSIAILPLVWYLYGINAPPYYLNSSSNVGNAPCKGITNSTSTGWGIGSTGLVYVVPARISDSTYPCNAFQFSDIVDNIRNFVKVGVVFQFIRSSQSTHEGWIIDNLSVNNDFADGITGDKVSVQQYSFQPNPAYDNVDVIGNPESLEIRDGFGNLVIKRESFTNTQLDIRSLGAGVYFAYFKSTDSYSVQKLVVAR